MKKFRYRLEFLGCRLAAGLIPRLPRRACLLLASILGELFFRLDRRSRDVALENLRLAFGDTLAVPARREIARKSFHNFARAMLDLFWARNLTPENYRQHIKAVNFDQALDVQQRDGGLIVLSMHAGSHEWLAMTTGFVGLPSTMVALDFRNPALDDVFRTARQQSGNRIIGQQQSMLKMLRTVRRGGCAGLLVDLGLRLNHPGQVIETFGMKMHATFLHAVFHARTGAAIIPVTNIPNADGTCTVTGPRADRVFRRGRARPRSRSGVGTSSSRSSGPGRTSGYGTTSIGATARRTRTGSTPSISQVSKKFERIMAGLPPVPVPL